MTYCMIELESVHIIILTPRFKSYGAVYSLSLCFVVGSDLVLHILLFKFVTIIMLFSFSKPYSKIKRH